jgi:hypothetical protein
MAGMILPERRFQHEHRADDSYSKRYPAAPDAAIKTYKHDKQRDPPAYRKHFFASLISAHVAPFLMANANALTLPCCAT